MVAKPTSTTRWQSATKIFLAADFSLRTADQKPFGHECTRINKNSGPIVMRDENSQARLTHSCTTAFWEIEIPPFAKNAKDGHPFTCTPFICQPICVAHSNR